MTKKMTSTKEKYFHKNYSYIQKSVIFVSAFAQLTN